MSSDVTYEGTGGLELLRAVGVWLSVVGTAAMLLLGGQLFVWDDPIPSLIALCIFIAGITLLLWSRARGREMWQRNKPYLLSEDGVLVTRGRREAAALLARISHWLLATFVVLGLAFFGFYSAINCEDRTDGYCGDVGTPPEVVVNALKILALGVGAAWAGVMSMRRRYDDETERIDIRVAEGQRMRRHDHPFAGTDRFSWE